jgi:hypothetical protein
MRISIGGYPSGIHREAPTTETRLERTRRFATWLDAGIAVPGTSVRIGLDPILGLVPGLGDALGALLAAWILIEGIRLGASAATLARLAGNIALDCVVGAIPVLGDAFDFVWKANLKNVSLLEQHAIDPGAARKRDRLFVAALVGAVIAVAAALLAGSVVLTAWLLRILFGA